MGTHFLKSVIEKFSCDFSLEVRKNNPAVNFYNRIGFKEISPKFNLSLNIKEPHTYSALPVVYWNPSRDSYKLNKLLKLYDENKQSSAGIMITYFPEGNFFQHCWDNYLRKLKNQTFTLYILEHNAHISYGIIYSYISYKISLIEIVSLYYDIQNEKFLSSLLNHVPSGNLILFSTMEEYLRDYFLYSGGKIYRENIIMKFVNL